MKKQDKTVVQLDIEFILALDDAKRSGEGVGRIRQMDCYKRILAAMDADGTGNTHEQNVLILPMVEEIKYEPPVLCPSGHHIIAWPADRIDNFGSVLATTLEPQSN
jgi:hypothetical protein